MMKRTLLLAMLFSIAGCQPDAQESRPPSKPPLPMEQKVVAPAVPEMTREQTEFAAKPAPLENKPQTEPSPRKIVKKEAPTVAEQSAAPTEVAHPEPEAPPKEAPADIVAPVQNMLLSDAEALALAKKKNCFACHALDKKVVGPAWQAIAEKYRGDVGAAVMLEAKVRKGGKGNWGAIAMPPQTALNEGELRGLVEFILRLK